MDGREKTIFIAATEKRSGKSLVTIGLIRALQGIIPNVGYMKPIGQRYADGHTIDEDAALIQSVFDLPDRLSDINPAPMEEAQGDKDKLFEKIFSAYGRLKADKDVVVIEGTDYTSALSALEFDINAELANNLVAPVLLVANGAGKSAEEIVQSAAEVTGSFRDAGCEFLGVIVNRFSPGQEEGDPGRLQRLLSQRQVPFFGAIPPNATLAGPRLREVAARLAASIVYKGDDMSKVVTDVKVLAMSPENALDYIKDRDGYLLITPGDRTDNILVAMDAQRSTTYPKYAGLVLTGGLIPGKNVRSLFKGMSDSDLTILSVPDDTYNTAVKVNQLSGEVTVEDREKIELTTQMVDRHVDIRRIYEALGSVETDIVTPRMFQYRLLQMAKADRRHIVLPEGTEPRIVAAAAEILERDICELTMLGDVERMRETARSAGVDIGGAHLADPRDQDEVRERYADTLYELRKHKSVTRDIARDLMVDPVYFATMMVYMGDADGFVSGATHSTADTLGPVLRVLKTAPGVSLASSIFFMCMPKEVLVYGDCALVENPNAEQLAEIAITSADTARAFGINPYVAILSYSTGKSGKGRDVDKVREAALIARNRRPDLPIEGPIQYDAAVSEDVARVKIKDSAVAGKATVYIFPDLDAGNTAYKAVQRSANVPAIGPVMQGLRKPANDLSRGATVVDIVYTIAITAVQAQRAGAGESREREPEPSEILR